MTSGINSQDEITVINENLTNFNKNTQQNDIESYSAVNKCFVPDKEEELVNLNNKNLPKVLDIPRKIIGLEKPKQKHWLIRRIYILTWIREYNKSFAISDLIAGITLGLTIIPQSIAYAALAGLPSQYGLYAAFMGSMVYVFFGTIKEVSIGPTSLMALLTLQYTFGKPVEFAIVLAFLAGIVELLMGILKLGFIVDFISGPVTSAFTSATSLIIIGSQTKNLFGIKYASKGFADSMIRLFSKITDTTIGDSILGLTSIIFLLCLRQLNYLKISTNTERGRILKKILWYISISRNALAVISTSVIAFILSKYSYGSVPFRLSDEVESGVPSFQLPPFTINYRNTTHNIIDICGELGSGIIVVPLVAVLANVAIAKAFATGGTVDASQEMLTLGLCNLIGSCFRSMPTCGAFTRSAVSQASGVKTPMAGIYSGTMVILALSLLTPYFKYIPRATLAAVLICAVIFMIDFKIVKKLWQKCRRDLIGWIGCFVACLSLGVEIGLLFGIVLNVMHLLFRWARPEIIVKLKEIDQMQFIYIAPNVGIFFPGIDYLREKIKTACAAAEYQLPIILDCNRISGLDYTSIEGIHNLAKDLEKHQTLLILQNIETKLEKYIDTTKHSNILFCNKNLAVKEILTQENIRNGQIRLENYIKASIDAKCEDGQNSLSAIIALYFISFTFQVITTFCIINEIRNRFLIVRYVNNYYTLH